MVQKEWWEKAHLLWRKVIGMDEELLPTKSRSIGETWLERSDKKLGQKSSQRQLSDARQLGCVFQDMKPPKSLLRKSTDMQRPIQRVKFKKAIARHTKIRDQNPSFGYICPGELHQRSPNAPKFEDRSLEETEWQEEGAREAAWKMAKNVVKFKEHERATFFSLSEIRCLLHQLLNLRNEILLSIPERQCTWSAKRTWILLQWILWRNRVVLR